MPPHLPAWGLSAALVCAGLLAASWGPKPASAKEELVVGLSQFPSTFHPSIDPMAAKSYVIEMARRPITAYDQDWQLVCFICTELPSLDKGTAKEVTRPDGRRAIDATFTLKPGLAWGDGTPVTTRDVMFTLDVGRHPKSGITNSALFNEDIAGITPIDDRTFTVHWSKYLCTYDSLTDFRLLPEHLERKVFEENPDEYRNRTLYDTQTTDPGLWFGPYRVTSVESGSHVVLEPNPTWPGKKPSFRRVIVRAIENTAALEANLLSGGIDMIAGETGVSVDQALAFERRHGSRFQVIYKPGLFYEHVDLNLDDPILADVRVRRALLHALDRETISKQLFGGKQPVAHNQTHPLDRVHVPGYPTYAYDLGEAKRLLDEAGWTDIRGGIRHDKEGRRLSFVIQSTAGNRSRELVQQVLQSQLRQAGIELRIENQPARVLFGETLRERKFPHMAMFAWLSSPENIPRTILHSSMIPTPESGFAGQNHTGFRNAEVDKVIDDLEVTCEEDKARPLWARLQQLYAEQLPALPLYYRADPFILPTWLEGVRPTGHQYGTPLWIEDWRVKR